MQINIDIIEERGRQKNKGGRKEGKRWVTSQTLLIVNQNITLTLVTKGFIKSKR